MGEEWNGRGRSEHGHVRKKPKLEKFVVSDVIKSPRKKSMDHSDKWRERKKQKKESKHILEEGGGERKTWKVVNSFDFENAESSANNRINQKKLDVVLTNSHSKKRHKFRTKQEK